jgi:hypothetical protein
MFWSLHFVSVQRVTPEPELQEWVVRWSLSQQYCRRFYPLLWHCLLPHPLLQVN